MITLALLTFLASAGTDTLSPTTNVFSLRPQTNNPNVRILQSGMAGVASLTLPTFVRAGTNGTTSTVNSLTISSFNCSGGNQLLIGICYKSSLTRSISSVTCSNVAASLVSKTNYIAGSGTVAIYQLASPTTGDVVVTLNGTVATGFSIATLLFNGVGSVGGSDATEINTSTSSISCAPTSLTTDLVVDILCYEALGGINVTPGASQTIRANELLGTTTDTSMFMSTKTGTASSTTMTWNADSTGTIMSIVGVALHGM